MTDKTLLLRVRQWAATVAVAAVLTYIGMVATTELRDYALVSADLAWLGIAAAVCGALLGVSTRSAVRLIVLSSVLAALMFAGIWCAVLDRLLGGYFSLFEIMISNLFFYLVLPKAAIVFLVAVFTGLLGVVTATILLPDHFRA